ncbi:MAG: S8 family peptidase, partial [Acutalibacteraceae bacterium]
MKKRLLSSALALILLITSSGGAFPACADLMLRASAAFEETLSSDASPAVETGNFEKQISTLTQAYPCDSAYSKIVIDIESNTLQKDGEDAVSLDRYGIDLSQADSPEMLIPAVPVLEAAGYNAELDEEKGEITVTDEESEKNLAPYEDVIENAESVGECENGFVTVSDGETSTKVPVGYLSEQQASDEFSLDAEYTDGKIIVTNRFQTRRLIVGVKDGKIKNTYSAAECIFDGDNRYVLQYDSESDAKEAYEQFENNRNIEYVCCDEVVASCAVSDRTGAEMIQSDRYKKYLAGNQKTTALTVAVVDTGADTAHELLKGRIVKGYNAIKNSTNVSDGNGHGTHVCGIVADNTPKNVKIMPVKVLADNGSGTDLQVSLGIDYAVKNGAKVINMSLGGLCSDPKCPIAVSVKKAIAAGVTVVVAAGNDTQDTKRYCPAGITDCITVSAYSQAGGTASFSNYGSAVDLCAPGDRIESSVPGNGYEILSGTSMASPFAAAAAAMLIINQPALKPAQVEAKLKTYCADMYTKGWDKYSGVGVINLGIALGDNRKANRLLMNDETVQINFFSKASWFYRPAGSVYTEEDQDAFVLTDYSVTAGSSDPTVAVFDGCYVIPKKPGKTTITVYPSGNGTPVSFDVVIRKIEVWIDYAAKAYSGGNGSANSPYLISTPEQLAKFALDVRRGVSFTGKYVRLTKDIDLAGKMWISAVYVTYFDSWLPGYAGAQPFDGHFDGGNHKIKNMTVFDDPLRIAWGEEHAVNELWYCFNDGFFSFVSGSKNDPCTIKNLGIENAYVSVSNSGILCGDLYQNTVVSNCYTTGFSVGNGLFGAVCNCNIRISNCYSSATVLQNGITDLIHSSRTTGKVILNNVFFCGEQLYSEAYTQSGAFCKTLDSDDICRYTELYNCFSAVRSVNNIGFANSSISSKLYNCYYLSGNADSIVNKKGNNAISLKAKTGDFFKTKDSYTTAANWNGNYPWDFKNTWAIDPKINGGYPYLKNNRPNKTAALHTETWLDKAADSFSGGNGSASSPYRIANAAELARMAKLLRYGGGKGVYFKLTADIDLKGNLWYPIGGGEYYNWKDGDKKGRNSASFSLDGSGKTIRNMTILSEGDCVGFICKAYGAEIKNLHFRDASVTGRNNVGILCAESAANTVIANCSVSGKVSGNAAVGGICAQNTAGSRIVATASAAAISANSICAGIAAVAGLIAMVYKG